MATDTTHFYVQSMLFVFHHHFLKSRQSPKHSSIPDATASANFHVNIPTMADFKPPRRVTEGELGERGVLAHHNMAFLPTDTRAVTNFIVTNCYKANKVVSF